jgi:TP53 regulating kinase-like protein
MKAQDKSPSEPGPKRQRTEDNVECANQGAEGRVFETNFLGRPAVCKERFAKSYRHPALDRKLRQQRLLAEARCLVACSRQGIDVPQVYFVDEHTMSLHLEKIDGWTVKEYLGIHESNDDIWAEVAHAIGTTVAKMHTCGIIHGDLTTSNMMIRRSSTANSSSSSDGGGDDGSSNKSSSRSSSSSSETKSDVLSVTLIDFGLGAQAATNPEDRAVDLYVLERAMASTHPGSETRLVPAVLDSYRKSCSRDHFKTMDKLAAVRLRGRKRMAFG